MIAERRPVCSSNTGVTVAGDVGSPPTVTTGRLLYPKPKLETLILAIANPSTDVPTAPLPVVSLASFVNDTPGADPDA